MLMASSANENVIMQPQIQPADLHSQPRDPNRDIICAIAFGLILNSVIIFVQGVLYGGWFWKLLAMIGPLSVVHALCAQKYASLSIEQIAEKRKWRLVLSFLQLAIGAAWPASDYMAKQTTFIPGKWLMFAIHCLLALCTSWEFPQAKDFGYGAIHPLPLEEVGRPAHTVSASEQMEEV